MERLIEYCKATTKEIESSFVLNFARTELQKFNSRVDRANARAINLDRMTQDSFIKIIPKDTNNNKPSCSGGSGDPVDGLKSQGQVLGFLKRHGRKNRVSETNSNKGEIDLGEKRLDAGEYEEEDVCEDNDGHFIPRKLLLSKVEKFKDENDVRLGVRKSTKTFRAPVPNCTRHAAAEDLENGGDERLLLRRSTKTFRAPDPPWIGDNGSRKSTKTFRAPDPNTIPAEYLEVPNTKPEPTSSSLRCRVKKFFGFR